MNRPFWFELRELFYEKLQKAAVEFRTTRAAIVTEAIKMKPEAPPSKKKRTVTTSGLTEAAKEKLVKEYFSRARLVGWEESRGQAGAPAFKPEDFTRIFWLDLPDSFFREVKNKAKRYGLSEKEFVRTSVEKFIREERKERKRVPPISDVQEQLIKEFSRTTGAMRWEQTSEKTRKDHARKMALKRWGKTE